MTLHLSTTRLKRQLTLAIAFSLAPLNLSCAQNAGVLPAAPVAAPQQKAAPRALWVWNAAVITQAAQRTQFFDFCKEKNLGVLYLTLGDLVDETKRSAEDPRHVTPDALGDFLETAHANNLRVEALDGDPHFSLAGQHETALKRLRGVIDYNRGATAARRLDGFQWDIEPYVLKEFQDKTQQATIVSQFLDIVKKSRDLVQAEKNIAGADGFWLGFALPFWMDGEEQSVTWGGEKRPATFHALQTLSTLPHSYIAIMAYRDKADGDNGTIAMVKGEMEYAARQTPGVQIVVGQETAEVKGDPPSITFYEEGEGALETALGQIDKEYSGSPVYGGIAIHHLDSYRDLIARLPKTAATTNQGEISLKILAPTANAKSGVEAAVSGQATGGNSVQISVMPAGDIWYEGNSATVSNDGTWSTPARLGNEQTPAGQKFMIRARLLDDAGKTLAEKQVEVTRE